MIPARPHLIPGDIRTGSRRRSSYRVDRLVFRQGEGASRHRVGTNGLNSTTESLILAQNERWRRGLGMQVERESALQGNLLGAGKVANG